LFSLLESPALALVARLAHDLLLVLVARLVLALLLVLAARLVLALLLVLAARAAERVVDFLVQYLTKQSFLFRF
jgi:hypothetical protein